MITPTGEGAVTGCLFTKDSLAVRMEDGSHGEVRLCTCECQKDGSLLVTPEEEPVAPIPWMDTSYKVFRSADEIAEVAASAAEGRGGQGEGSQTPEGGAEGTGPGRSRRSRSRRRGRGRGQGQGQPGGEAPVAGAGGAARRGQARRR